MKPVDYRPYVITALINIAAFFLYRTIGDDHAAVQKADETSKSEVKATLRELQVQVGAARDEINRNYLEFKEFKVSKDGRDAGADKKLDRIEGLLLNQSTRFRRMVYMPRRVEIGGEMPMRSDTVKVEFFVKR